MVRPNLVHDDSFRGLAWFRGAWRHLRQNFDRRTHYRFHDRWNVAGRVEDVAEILRRPERLSDWWPQFRSVSLRSPGDEDGLGCQFDTRIKGFLPHTVALSFHVDHVRYPHEFSVRVAGDFTGRGSGHLRQHGTNVRIDLLLEVELRLPRLRWTSFLLRSIMSLQHNYVMAGGGASLSDRLRQGGLAVAKR